ncbi:hypothetical protein ABBQ38_003227 [Trebouxia sp. C0009 RCD-2024]
MFGTSAYQYNPRHSAAPSEMPRGIKMEHNSDTTVAAVPQTDDLIKLGKRKAWAKFLAYEGSFQVCLDKIGDSTEAQSFLAEGCRPLKTAFAFEGLLLRPAAAGVPPGGQTILWDDSEATILPAPMSRELLEAPPSPPQAHHQASRSVIVMPQHAPQQSMQQVETIPGRPVIKASAVRLVSSHLYQPFEQDKMGSLQSLFGKVAGSTDQLYICLHPASAPEEAAAWTVVQAGGRGKSGDQVELGQEEVDEELLVEVHNCQEPVAQGVVRAADLLQAAHNSPAQGHGSPRKQKQAGFISRLCGRSSQYEDAHVPGKKWVQVFDHAGAKWGHVLLSSWLDTSEEMTVMHQAPPPMPMMQPLMALPQQPYLPPPPSYLPPLQNTRDLSGGVVSQGKGYQQLTSWQVYDVVLDAALQTQKCGPRNLLVTGDWEWLLNAFADFYGIRHTYTVLAHLRWAIKQENATVTAECLEMLSAALKPLKEAEANGGLLPQEVAILSRVENATEALLARCFENYYSLQENAPNGLLDGGVAAAEQPAPALQPAVELCNILRDVLKPGDQQWLTDRFKVAAKHRYHRLLDGADATINRGRRGSSSPPDSPRGHQQPGGPLGTEAPHYDPSQGVPVGSGTEQDAEAAYHRLELLSQSIRNELQRDLHIHDSAVLPNFINLPQVTAAEYTRLYLSALQDTLDRFPPPQPSEAAVNLLVTVGQQQEFLLWHSLLPPPGHPGSLDALEVFTPHVERWIRNSQDALCQRCHQLEGSTQALQGGVTGEDGKSHIAPLVGEMLQRIQAEVARYERVISYWPSFGPSLEGAVCAALRTTTAAVSRQCGLIPMIGNEEEMGGPPHQRKASNVYGGSGPPQKSPRLWKFAPARGGNANNTGVLPFEAILLNSLRRLLTVVPQTEHTLSRWCGSHSGQRPGSPNAGPPSPGRDGTHAPGALTHDGPGPHLGAQFAQLVKELRSEYAAAVTACAERIAGALFQRPGYSINATLHRHGISGTPTIMQQQVGPVLEAMEDILAALLRSLDGRVYVAVGRGLWDFTSKDIYDYVDSLQEGKENKGAWRGRQNAAAALSVVDNFFTAVLSGTLQHELQSKDLDLPLHSDRAHKLLAENTAAINMSYTVY